MPRLARIDAAGILHHVIVRGIEKKPVFKARDDKEDFIYRLSCLVIDTRHAIYAWAVMTNHVHLLVRTGDVPLSKLMARLLTGYAASYNKRHNRVGHLFQNRYKSIICEEEPYCKELIRYIHLNPLRTGLVPNYDRLCNYPWSGHSALTGARDYVWQDTAFVLALFGNDPDESVHAYREFVASGIHLGHQPELTGGGLIRSLGGWEQAKHPKA
ncbi:MAG: transposase [Syntrophorhabdaceae bacterium]